MGSATLWTSLDCGQESTNWLLELSKRTCPSDSWVVSAYVPSEYCHFEEPPGYPLETQDHWIDFPRLQSETYRGGGPKHAAKSALLTSICKKSLD